MWLIFLHNYCFSFFTHFSCFNRSLTKKWSWSPETTPFCHTRLKSSWSLWSYLKFTVLSDVRYFGVKLHNGQAFRGCYRRRNSFRTIISNQTWPLWTSLTLCSNGSSLKLSIHGIAIRLSTKFKWSSLSVSNIYQKLCFGP